MATINDFGIPEVNTGILHPKVKNLWRVQFADIAGGTDTKDLSFQAINITRPNLSFEEIQLDRYNSRSWVAGKHTFEPITLTIEDDIASRASKIIRDQMEYQQHLIGAGASGDFLGKGTEGSYYKFVMKIQQLDGKNSAAIEQWDVEGCWLQAVDYGDLDYAASEAAQITLTVRYDHARQEILGEYNGDKSDASALGGPS